MQFTAEHYYRTANERMIEAVVLYERQRYGCSWLNDLGAYHGVKGDVLKANALRLLRAAQTIVDTGVLLWTSKKK